MKASCNINRLEVEEGYRLPLVYTTCAPLCDINNDVDARVVSYILISKKHSIESCVHSPWTIHGLMQRSLVLPNDLRLPEGALADLYEHLKMPNAVAAAGLPHHVRNYLTALHSDTWFYVEGQADICRTSVGSRPGDCFADTIFGYLWAKVLRQIEGELCQYQILDYCSCC